MAPVEMINSMVARIHWSRRGAETTALHVPHNILHTNLWVYFYARVLHR